MGFNNDGMGLEEKKTIADMISALPAWAQTAVSILAIIAAAAVAGWVVGKLYAMVKYPDPEKQGVVSPKIKVAFICLLAICCAWLYTTMMKEKQPQPEPGIEGEVQSSDGGMDYAGGYGAALG